MTIVFQILEVFFGCLGSYSTKKKNIFIFFILSTVFSMLMFWSVGSYEAILPVLTTGIRYFIFIFKDKYKTNTPLIFCLIMHLAVFAFTIKIEMNLLPSILVILGCLIYWYLDKEKLKLCIFIINIPWIIYYFSCGLYLATANAIVQTILVGLAYLKIKRIKKKFRVTPKT